MTQEAVQYLLAALALVVLLETLRTSGRTLLAGLPLLIPAGISVGGEALPSGTMQKVVFGGAAVVFVWLALMTFLRARRRGGARVGDRRPVLALLLLVAWIVAIDAHAGIVPWSTLLPRFAVALLMLLGTVLLWQAGGFSGALVSKVALLVLSGILLASYPIDEPWRACDQFKCGTFGALYKGPFSSENYLAMVAAFALALVVTSLTGFLRFYGATLCTLTIIATGSRSGLIAGGVVVLVTIAISIGGRAFRGLRRPRPRSRALPLLLAGGVAFTGIYLAVHATADSFSNRGQVWELVLKALQGYEWTGRGASTYEVLQDTGDLSIHFPHSEYLFTMFAGGYIAVGMYVLWIASLMRAQIARGGFIAGAVPLAMAVNGLTEITWNMLVFDGLAWMSLAMTLVAAGRVDAEPDLSDEPDDDAEAAAPGDSSVDGGTEPTAAVPVQRRPPTERPPVPGLLVTFGAPSSPGTVFGHPVPVSRLER